MGQHTGTSAMAVKCLCGFEAWATEDELIVIVHEHGIEAHNANVTYERVFEMLRSESSDATASSNSCYTTAAALTPHDTNTESNPQ